MGGHAERLLEAGGAGTRLLGIDGDPEALARAGRRLARFGDRVVLRQGSFRDLGAHAGAAGVTEASAVLLDLGLSSYQLEESGRGFSFQGDEPLDMRFDPTRGATAAELLNRLTQEELARILFEYGEERHARRIARRIVERRKRAPLTRTRAPRPPPNSDPPPPPRRSAPAATRWPPTRGPGAPSSVCSSAWRPHEPARGIPPEPSRAGDRPLPPGERPPAAAEHGRGAARR